MSDGKDTTPKHVFAQCRFEPPVQIRGDAVFDTPKYREAVSVLEDLLQARFLPGKEWLFNKPLGINGGCINQDNGHLCVFLMHEPEAYGFTDKDEAVRAFTNFIYDAGYQNIEVCYSGGPRRASEIDALDFEAKLDRAVRVSIAERFGKAAAKKTIRTRVIDAPYSWVNLESSKIFRGLSEAAVNGVKDVTLPLALPDGTHTHFKLRVEKDGLVPDLTAHFFGDRKFKKIVPFHLHITMTPRSNAYTLVVYVSPETLGYKTQAAAHAALKTIAIDLGYTETSLKMSVAQATNYTLAQIDEHERKQTSGTVRYRPLNP